MADRWLTFDCFGTLIDWRHGIRTTGELLFPGRGEEFLNAYIALEPEVEEGPFKRYRAVLTETARRAVNRLSARLRLRGSTSRRAISTTSSPRTSWGSRGSGSIARAKGTIRRWQTR